MNLQDIIQNIQKNNTSKKIVLPNPNDERILEAVKILLEQGHSPVLCGRKDELVLYNDIEIERVINDSEEDNNTFAAKILADGKVEAMISGNMSSTADVVRSLIRNVGTKPDIKRLSSHFLMQTHLGLMLVADAAIQADPDAEQLAEIALLTAQSAILYGLKPKIAMLSFSTNGSASHPMVEKVQNATILAKQLLAKHKVDAEIEGELQVDSAVIPEVALLKNPESVLKGKANILIFPDLNSGNIGYKLIQRFGKAQAIGPIIQGLNKAGNDLSRGCSTEDILHLYYITANS